MGGWSSSLQLYSNSSVDFPLQVVCSRLAFIFYGGACAKDLDLLASLWLCPPKGSLIEAALIRLITTTIPTHFGDEKVPTFQPHMTLTSDIPPELDPQTIIDSISISSLPEVVFSCMKIGSVLCPITTIPPSAHNISLRDTFFTRGTLYLERTPSLLDLATQCREKFTFGGQSKEDVQKWADGTFNPHLSLVYSKLWPVPKDIFEGIERDVITANVGIPCSSSFFENNLLDTMKGWQGGRILLVSDLYFDLWDCNFASFADTRNEIQVQTNKPIDQWVPLAEKVISPE